MMLPPVLVELAQQRVFELRAELATTQMRATDYRNQAAKLGRKADALEMQIAELERELSQDEESASS